MIKNKLMLGRIKNSGLLTVLLIVLLACSQTVVAQGTVPSGYPIIGSVISQQFNVPPPFKPAKYRVSLRPQHGTVTLLDEVAGIYQYRSHSGYVGEDYFSITDESPGGPFGYSVSINVTESVQYVVTKTVDTQDGVCDDDCSFSEAVEAANANPGIDVIVIPAGVYPINPQTITDHLIIDGKDIGQTSLLGNGFRTNGADLQLSNLSYIGNLFDPNSSGIDPFIINIANSLIAPSISLYRVRITETIGFNSLYPGLNGIGRMLAFESEFLRYGCGAVLVGNEIIASRIAITEGGISDANCSGQGHTAFAAIATQNYSMPGTVNIFSSSIHNNFSMPLGLISIWPGNFVTSFNMINTSIHNNAGYPFGALIHMLGLVEANIINSTVVGNSDAAAFYAGFSTTVWLTNNILAYNNTNYNQCNSPTGPIEPFISRGNNFFTRPNGCNLHPSDITNGSFYYEIGTDYYLPLENFQYIVPAHYQADVIDGANDDYCPHIDIEGFQRPFEADGDGVAQCDIGVYEILSKKLDIFANDVADYLVLNTSDLLTLTISLSSRDLPASAEWWVYADTAMGPYYFDSSTNSWQPGQGVSYQRGITEFDSQQAIPVSGFPAGLYKFYFNVDTMIDGVNNNRDNAAGVEVLLEPPKSCDANGDNNIDRNDIVLIMMARNTPATGLNDPRDNDGDGIITVLDARQCILQCDLNNCAVQ